jgi:hypothetical protein
VDYDYQTEDAAKLEAMTNQELLDALGDVLGDEDSGEELWAEVGFRLGVEGIQGTRTTTTVAAATGRLAARLRRYVELWQGQPEAEVRRQEVDPPP